MLARSALSVTKSPFSLHKAPMPLVQDSLINELIKGTWVAGGNNLSSFCSSYLRTKVLYKLLALRYSDDKG